MSMFKSDAESFIQKYCEHVLVPAVRAAKPESWSVEFDSMTGTIEIYVGSLIILATPFYEGCAGLPIEIRDDKDEEIVTALHDLSLSGNPRDDAEKYLSIVKDVLKI
jgi:hypothetical protein